MALFPSPANSWMQRTGFPAQVFGNESLGGDDYELYEEDGAFVLTVDEERGRTKTDHRRFRFPKDVDEDAITARYENGVLEVTLPTLEETAARGEAIPIEG